jgi:hypothetical protein
MATDTDTGAKEAAPTDAFISRRQQRVFPRAYFDENRASPARDMHGVASGKRDARDRKRISYFVPLYLCLIMVCIACFALFCGALSIRWLHGIF